LPGGVASGVGGSGAGGATPGTGTGGNGTGGAGGSGGAKSGTGGAATATGGAGGAPSGTGSISLRSSWPTATILTGVRDVVTPPATQTVQLRNDGTGPVTITAVALAGTNASAFRLTVDDQVDVLDQIVLLRRRAAESSDPTRDILVGVVVDRRKIASVQGCLFR
jgi:hypothetical protein